MAKKKKTSGKSTNKKTLNKKSPQKKDSREKSVNVKKKSKQTKKKSQKKQKATEKKTEKKEKINKKVIEKDIVKKETPKKEIPKTKIVESEIKSESKNKKKEKKKKEKKIKDKTEKQPKQKEEKEEKKKKEKKEFNFKEKIIKFTDLLLGRSAKQKNETQAFWGIKFAPLILIFLLYSLLLVIKLNVGTLPIYINWLMIGTPYIMGVSLVFSYISMMFLFVNNKLKTFIFGKKTVVKQIIFTALVVLLNYLLWRYLIEDLSINVLPTLFIFAMFWLLFQGIRLYYDARGFATRMESKMLSRYSSIRFAFVLVMPFIILAFLTTSVWAYRYFLVIITLDFLGVGVPYDGIAVYQMQMTLFLPFLYISLISIFVLITIEFILSMRQSENRRVGAFDNFAYSLIVFFMFFYLLYQVTLFLMVNGEFNTALSNFANIFNEGSESGTSVMAYVFIIEFSISMLFLLMGIKNLSASFGWNFLFINQDGLVMGFLAFVMAQTTSRVALVEQIPSQTVGTFGELLALDHLIIPVIIIIFLGITILIYYIKPQEVSMFMRINKESVNEQDKSMDIILKTMKREFIRRGDKYPLEEVMPQLLSVTELQRTLIEFFIRKLDEKYMDFAITEEETDTISKKFVDFISVTEKYQSSKVAETKVKKFMINRLMDTMKTEEPDHKELAIKEEEKGQMFSVFGEKTIKEIEEKERLEKEKEEAKLRKKEKSKNKEKNKIEDTPPK